MDERLLSVVAKAHSEYKDVRYSVYRTSLKLRRIQKTLKLDKIDVAHALSILSQPLEGLSVSSPDQSYPNINADGLLSVICRVFTHTQTKLGDHEVFPEALAELTCSLVLQTYDKKKEAVISMQAVRTFFIVMGDRELVAKYKSLFWCYCEPGNKTLAKRDVWLLLTHMIQITRFIEEASHFENIAAAVESCFSKVFGSGITESDFLRWCLLEPQSVLWLPTMHRIASAETSQHPASCTSCKTRPITGLRFRCLRCLDYNVCQRCFLTKTNFKKSHKPSHPIQEYVHPVGRRDSMKDLARTFRNMVTKRYKRKTYTRSFLPISQSGATSGMVTESWQEETVEMASLSLPNLRDGAAGTTNQDLGTSRMSAGFSDVSQLADEEKENLDRLIERLEEERRRMTATTKILAAAQTQRQIEPAPTHTEKTPREKERERLQTELKGVRNYNQELEKELEQLRACLRPDELPRTSTPHVQHPHKRNMHHSPLTSQHTDPYFTPDSTAPKDPYLSHIPYEQGYSTAHEDYLTPSSADISPYQSKQYDANLQMYSQPIEKHAASSNGHDIPSLTQPLGSHPPRFEKLKGFPNGYSSKSLPAPMKVQRGSYRSLGTSPVPLDGEGPLEFSKRSYRSLGNSPRSMDYGDSFNSRPWGATNVLPDHPQIKMAHQTKDLQAGPNHHFSANIGAPNSPNRFRSSHSFDGSSPQRMYQSIGKKLSSRSSSLTDMTDSFNRKTKPKRPSSHDRSSGKHHNTSPGDASDSSDWKTRPKRRSSHSRSQRSASPALTEDHRRDLERHFSHQSIDENLRNLYRDAPGYDQSPASIPRPRRRQKLNDAIQRSLVADESKSFESDSLSDASSRKSGKLQKTPDRPQSRSHSRKSSRHSSKERKPSSQKRSQSKFNDPRTSHLSEASLTIEDPRSGHSRRSSHSEPQGKSHSISESSDDAGFIDSRLTRSAMHGSFVPPRITTSQENLASVRSVDSLDSLHGGMPHAGYGVLGDSRSEATSTAENSPRNFDPYSDIHSNDPNLQSKLPPDLQARRGASMAPQNKHSSSLDKITRQIASQVQSSSHDGDDTSHSSIHITKRKHGSFGSTDSIGSRKSGSHRKKGKARRSSPALVKKTRETTDGDTSDSRTTPEGDLEGHKTEDFSDERSFKTPEEEMKFLINRLQGLMPSIHDLHVDSKSSTEDSKLPKPMNEILLAAHETRQSIRLFTEYAIAVAAGEV